MSNATAAVKQKLISQLIQTSQGREKLAASMTQPLRLRRDYTSVGRKTFLVEQLPDGALPIYDKDPDVAAYVVGEEGNSINSISKSRRVMFPLFELATLTEIPLTQIRERRFDVIERNQELGKVTIQAAEDERVFAVMDALALNGFDSVPGQFNPDIPVVAPINAAALSDAMANIQQHDLSCARIFMNAKDYSDLRKFNRDVLDMETQRELVQSGILGSIYGAKVIVSRLVPAGTVYLTTEPEMFGRIPVRTELTVLSADDPKARTIGFSIFENIGIGAYNPKGLARITVAR